MPGDAYENLLAAHRQSSYYVVEYPGNQGDFLLQQGTLELLRRLKIRTTDDARDAEIVLWPGGNVAMWRLNLRLLHRVARRNAHTRILIGPAGFAAPSIAWAPLLRSLAPRLLSVFARERASFEALRGVDLGAAAAVGLSHDPVLQLRDSSWLRPWLRIRQNKHVLAAFRDDHEACGPLARSLRLLHYVLPYAAFRPVVTLVNGRARRRRLALMELRAARGWPRVIDDVSRRSLDTFLRCLARAKEIHTDRLHVMLVGALFEKPVFAYATAYAKLEAVYEHSLKSWSKVMIVSER